jgi:hypothetical protein
VHAQCTWRNFTARCPSGTPVRENSRRPSLTLPPLPSSSFTLVCILIQAFNDWCNTIDKEFIVKKILIQSVDMFGSRMGFVKFKGDVTDKEGRVIPSIVFMRGASVGMLIVITCEEDKKQ